MRGRDLGGFVTEAQEKIGQLNLPAGMYTDWGGTFESLQSARLRLLIVVPICFLAIYALLYMALGGFVPAAIVFSAVPMALAGGVFALLLSASRVGVISFMLVAAFLAIEGTLRLSRRLHTRLTLRLNTPGPAQIRPGLGEARLKPLLSLALLAAFAVLYLAAGAGLLFLGARFDKRIARAL